MMLGRCIRAVRRRAFPVVAAAVLCALPLGGALAASPSDPVRARYAGSFQEALSAYERLGGQALAQARQGLIPMGEAWAERLRAADRNLIPHERTFFPMMHRPWTREAAVFSNLQGARMWLWSVYDALHDGANGVESLDVAGGKVRAELLTNFSAYLAKARDLLNDGEFKGSYFEDTLIPVVADYCTYPEDGSQARPDFAKLPELGEVARKQVAGVNMGGL